MPTPQILLFNLDTPKGAKIRRMCLPLKIRTRLVPQEAYGLPLSALVAGNLEAPAPTEEQPFLTQTNQDWLPIALRAELLREREAIAQGGSAHEAP